MQEQITANNVKRDMRTTNPSHWPKVQINIEKACHEIFLKHGQFDLRRGEPSPKAKTVIKYLEKIADKYKLKREHLYMVYFGKE